MRPSFLPGPAWLDALLSFLLSALLTAAVIAFLYWLGAWDFSPPRELFLPSTLGGCQPEPDEHLAYLLMAGLPPLIFLALGRGFAASSRNRLAPALSRLFPFLFLLSLVLVWHRYNVTRAFPGLWPCSLGTSAAAGLLWLERRGWLDRVPAWGAVSMSVLYAAYRLLPAVQTEGSFASAAPNSALHFSYLYGELVAVLGGRTLWANFVPQYQNLYSYCLEPWLKVFGHGILSYTLALSLLSLLAMSLVVTALFRLAGATSTGWTASLIFLSSCFYPIVGSHFDRPVFPFNYYVVGPIRYFGPWVVFWALSREESPSRTPLTAFLASCAALANLDFGLPAWGAALIASAVQDPRPRRAACWFVAMPLAVFGGFLAFTAARTWVLEGTPALVQPGALLTYQRAFASYGFMMLRMPWFGFQWDVYLALMACVFAGISFARQSTRRVRAAAILYAGLSGLGEAMYYVGRSHQEVLVNLIPAFGLALAALIASMPREERRGPLALGTIWLLAGGSFCLSTLAVIPGPLNEFRRLQEADPRFHDRRTELVSFVRAHARPREAVAILYPFGSAIALESGVQDVSPFVQDNSIVLRAQLERFLAALRSNRVRWAFGSFPPEVRAGLLAAGFQPRDARSDFEALEKTP